MKTLAIAFVLILAVATARAADAVALLYPKLVAGTDYTLAPDDSIATWSAAVPQPSTAQMAKAVEIMTLRLQLRAAIATLPPGERALIAPAFSRVAGRFGRAMALARTGDLAAIPATLAQARAIVATFPAVTPSMEAARAQLLALLPE